MPGMKRKRLATVAPQSIKFMDLDYDIRNMIYRELIGNDVHVWIYKGSKYRSSQKCSNCAKKLLSLSKEIHVEVKAFILHRNLHFTRVNGFIALDHFLNTVGTPALPHLRHITVHAPFLTTSIGLQWEVPGYRSVGHYLSKFSAAMGKLGFSLCDRPCRNQPFLAAHADHFRHACTQLSAATELRALDIVLPFYFTVKNGHEYLSFDPDDRHFDRQISDDAYWTELELLGARLPGLDISLVLNLGNLKKKPGFGHWMYGDGSTADTRLKCLEQDWVLRRAKSLGWKIKYAREDEKHPSQLTVVGEDFMRDIMGPFWEVP